MKKLNELIRYIMTEFGKENEHIFENNDIIYYLVSRVYLFKKEIDFVFTFIKF